MKYSIINLGCKVNSYESDFIREKFNEAGYSEIKLEEKPDIIVVNTCSVTNQSDAKSRHMVRHARKCSEDAIIVACGCSVQNHRDLYKDCGADILIGNKDKSKILSYITAFTNKKSFISKYYDLSNTEFEDMYLKSENNKTRAFVKIQDGCNNFCSYCIIPYMRGNIRSKDIDVATLEIKNLVDAGHKEIVLTGIHTGSYGRGYDYDLTDLIQRISKFDNLKRIRISSIEITELNEKFLNELKNNLKICNHLHIPLQTGNDEILKYMNRKYDTDFFRNKIKEIRNIRPNISITTDLIVGFPHESNEHFEDTLSFIKEIGFTKIHTFPFSLRNGTKAEEMKDFFVNDFEKKERTKKVISLSQELEKNYYKKFIGENVSIIVEQEKNGLSKGHTDNYIEVTLDKVCEQGELVDCKIIGIDSNGVNGAVI